MPERNKKQLIPAVDDFYIDAKGRTRWLANDALGELLKQLYAFLVIGNYEESHAARYPRLAHAISRYPESILLLKEEDRLQEIPGVSKIISGIIGELLETGTCRKMKEGDEFFTPPPKTVLELVEIPRLGAKTAKKLFQEHGIDSLAALQVAARNGSLEKIEGIGKAMVAAVLQFGK
ncbi:MAG: helix-hairpin-helix domain-containing protein [Pirellulaceae bacterium]|nr:helix-hairpin-helix domain-containing protein [Pirellulaceae bacterium]